MIPPQIKPQLDMYSIIDSFIHVSLGFSGCNMDWNDMFCYIGYKAMTDTK